MDNHIIHKKEEVEKFLNKFFPKMKVFGIIFLGRGKNLDALKMLGISPKVREEIIKELKSEDYVETIKDLASYGDMYVFGKDYEGTELYIKVSIGRTNNSTICVSFHIAEHSINYPYK